MPWIASIHGDCARLQQVHAALEDKIIEGDRLVYLGNVLGRGRRVFETVEEVLGFRRAFLAIPGNDIKDFLNDPPHSDSSPVHRFITFLATTDLPLVAAVDGPAVGIGTTMHFHCDLTFATPRSEFRTPFVDLALLPEAGSSLLGPDVMGYQRAFAMLAAGTGFSAEEAREAG